MSASFLSYGENSGLGLEISAVMARTHSGLGKFQGRLPSLT